jgi:anaerobic selenocysteine-containing dehydrogenase
MHPSDAAARALKTGDEAQVTSRTGAVRVEVEVTAAISPGVVSLPHGWGHHRDGTAQQVARARAGVSANDLTDETFLDALSANASLNGVAVEVERP